ncbi:DUF1285 domain-containing protein [Acinetobacter nectaris]|uniref:DUF1285 domain-containing protein n=1 Tax=Acinetobacter nectaris TaxID=1219382 RepID=UPI001F352621|nr:DUF1285 domain-containing protein [Acinetobacter nectaris]MCF9033468.1 DUF1285 domain-containing protein [Acinetobacter nectaris]
MGKGDISLSMYKKQSNLNNKSLDSILQSVKAEQTSQKKQIPPLDQWNPQSCGKMDLCIRGNGTWWHEGVPIQRASMIQLFSHILCKEEDKYYLKTPAEKIEIQVEDAPLFVNRIEQVVENDSVWIYAYTTDNDIVVLNEKNSIVMKDFEGEVRPYIYIRYGLYALIQRSAFFHLIDAGELVENEQGQTELILQSGDFRLHLMA